MSSRKSIAGTVATSLITLFLAIAVQPANAAAINWSTAQNITGASDVVTTGTLFSAANFFQTGQTNFPGADNVTVNGVTFTGFSVAGGNTAGPTTLTAGNITVTGTSNEPTLNNLKAFTPAGGPTGYNGLLNQTLFIYNSSTTSATGKTLNFSINGLTLGAQYLIQYWVQDDRNVPTVLNRTVVIGGQSLRVNSTGATSGGLGQYITGTFTADSSLQQTFSAVGGVGNVAYANAMQVRLLAVPEPSTWAIAGVGLACAVIGREVRRRRRNQQRFSAAD